VDVRSKTCPVVAEFDSEAWRRACEHVVLTTASLAPLIVKAGLAEAADLEVGLLSRRPHEELSAAKATFFSPAIAGAWARRTG
jgi:hypothetical protein